MELRVKRFREIAKQTKKNHRAKIVSADMGKWRKPILEDGDQQRLPKESEMLMKPEKEEDFSKVKINTKHILVLRSRYAVQR